MPTRAFLPTLLAFLGLCLACSDRPDSLEQPVVPEWRLEVQGRIGSLDDPEQMLTDVDQVAIGPDGQLFVPQDKEIFVYDAAGVRIGTIGREGEGPGEFTSLRYVGLVGGDTLYAAQVGQISYFSLDGRFLRSTRLEGEPIMGPGPVVAPQSPQALVRLSEGTALVSPTFGIIMYDAPRAGTATLELLVPILRVSQTSEIQDTVLLQDYSSTSVWLAHEGDLLPMGSPFPDVSFYGLMPDGSGVVAVDRPSTDAAGPPIFRVTLVSPTRDTVFVTPIAYEPVPVATDLLAKELQERADRQIDGPSAPEIGEALREAGLIPETLPPVTGSALGQDGTIWIKREETLADAVLWQVLGPGGELEGELHVPKAQNVVAAQGDLMIAVELDALDVPYIVRYRILK